MNINVSFHFNKNKIKTEGTVTEMDDPSQEYKRSVGVTLNVKALKNHAV